MNLETLKTLLIKSKTKSMMVGVLVLVLGAGILAGILSGGTSTGAAIAGWIFGGLFTALGLFMAIKGFRERGLLNAGQDPLINAISNKNGEFVVWIYQQSIQSKVEGIKVATTANINIYDRSGKLTTLILGRGVAAQPVLDFLYAAFPKAHTGFSDETRKTVSALLKKAM